VRKLNKRFYFLVFLGIIIGYLLYLFDVISDPTILIILGILSLVFHFLRWEKK